MTEAYDGRQVVGMDLHRRRSVLVRMTEDGRRLGTVRITNSPAELRREIARAGKGPIVFLTSHLPRKGSEGDVALRSADDIVFDVIEMRTSKGYESLRKYAAGGHT